MQRVFAVQCWLWSGLRFANEKTTFNDPSAVQNLDSYIASEHLLDNSFNDARKFSAGLVVTPFFSLELGTLSFTWQHNIYYKVDLAGGQSFAFGYILPIRRIMKAYRGNDLD